jgi:hypothetical protein
MTAKPPRLYAQGTKVAVENSRAEVERYVRKRGATSFGTMTTSESSVLLFEARGRRIKFEIPVPKIARPDDRDAEERRRWRCLVLSVKAKFEAVDSGIVTFEEEFLAHIVVPGTGESVGKWIAPQIAAAYDRGAHMMPLLGPASP